MAYTIANAKDSLSGILHGTNLNKIQDIYGIFARAGRQILLDCDPSETRRVSQIENALYDDVYDYAAPSDLKGKKVIDIRPQTNRGLADNLAQNFGKQFDLYKTDSSGKNKFAIEDRSGVKVLRIAKDLSGSVLLHGMDGISTNGAWAVGGGASGLAVDTLFHITGGASLSFDVAGSTTSFIELTSAMTAVDLSDESNISSLFLWLYVSTPANLTSVELRWGSSSADYYSRTVTTSHPTSSFQAGWNLLRFDWDGATVTGTPVDTAMDYLRVSLAHTATDTNYRVDSIMAKQPSIFEAVYYSKFIFRNSSGTWIETPTTDSDLVNLDTDSYNLFLDKSAVFAAQQMSGVDSGFDVTFFEREYQDGLIKYQASNKSEYQMPTQFYYHG